MTKQDIDHSAEKRSDRPPETREQSAVGATELHVADAKNMSVIESTRTNASDGSAGGNHEDDSVSIGVVSRTNPLSERELIAIEAKRGDITPGTCLKELLAEHQM